MDDKYSIQTHTVTEKFDYSIQLVRSLMPSNNLCGVFPPTVEPDKKTHYRYEAFMEKLIFFVSHGQTSEIIGDEPWMDSEINCLCNVASGRKILFTLGSKRKSMDLMEINIGDWVTVSNHGSLFPQAQVKEIDFSKNLAKVNGRFHVQLILSRSPICIRIPQALLQSKSESRQTSFIIIITKCV
jgi:hypothetical protein